MSWVTSESKVSSVVLPQPFGPIKAILSFSFMPKVAFSNRTFMACEQLKSLTDSNDI